MTVLVIAGHGKARSGKIDPGATGYIEKGEHRYMKENLFPAMKKYVGNADIVFFSDYDVFEHGNIVELARKYGKDTTVIECHFDALGPDASGGHVIVKAAYAPDKLDLRLRDAIKSMVGVRYNHKGEQGISGRDNLANVNRTAQAGINYRLIELGFGTNKKDADILMNKTDEYAKKLVEAILNKTAEKQPVADKPAESKPTANPAPAAKPQATGDPIIKVIQANVGTTQDGWDGPNTRKGVVKLFQRYFGANADGIICPETLGKSQVIRSGSQGWHVYAVQAMLYLKGYKSVGKPDKIWGTNSIQACKNFQKDNGLGVDGTPGRNTYAKLMK